MPSNTRKRPERRENGVNSALRTVWWETFELWDQVLYSVGLVYDKVKRPKK